MGDTPLSFLASMTTMQIGTILSKVRRSLQGEAGVTRVFSGREKIEKGLQAGSLKVCSGSGTWTSLTAGAQHLSWEPGQRDRCGPELGRFW